VDGEVPSEVRHEIEHHLTECRTCQILYDTMKKTLVVVTEAGSFELPEPLASRIRSRVMAAIRALPGPAGTDKTS
jgi:predicted anti-sigma-YlaC factor YlaD